MDLVCECASKLTDFVGAVYKQDWGLAHKLQQDIAKHEAKADEIKQQIRLQMPNSLFMPVSRTDLLELLREQDNIANKVKDVAGIILGRKMQIPQQIQQDFSDFVGACINAANQAKLAVKEIDDLLETGFKGTEAKLVNKIISELDFIERQTDEIQVKVRSELFAIEQQYPPIDMIFLYKVIDRVGSIADRAQKVGHRLQLLIAS